MEEINTLLGEERFAPELWVDLSQTPHGALFDGCPRVWDVLGRIAGYLDKIMVPKVLGEIMPGAYIGPKVRIESGTVVEPGACILGPAWIGKNSRIRCGCYIRENVCIGDHVVAGNSCEFKNSVVFNHAEVPHFNYVGDSVLGYKAHLGAGVILSNVKLTRDEVCVNDQGRVIGTGLRKFGAIVGDMAEVGCNAVINPGALLGRGSLVYPGAQWRGVLPEHHVARFKQAMQVVKRRS
jgi:NDP-sugar pyrophosphorylase family protein